MMTSRILIFCVLTLGWVGTALPRGAELPHNSLPSRLQGFGDVQAWIVLSPSKSSDSVDYQVALAMGPEGKVARYVYGRTDSMGQSDGGSRIYVDRNARTYEAVRLTGTSQNVDRILALERRKKPNVSRETIAAFVARRVAGHSQFVAQSWRLRQRHLLGRGGLIPDGAAVEADDEAFGCPMGGSVSVTTEDPIYIDVAHTVHTQYATRVMDGWVDSAAFGDCWDKDAYGYAWPLNTEWYEDSCYQVGSSDYYTQDASQLGMYHNDDWKEDELSTNVIQQAGIQLEGSWVNWWTFDEISGEDSDYLESSEDHNVFSECSPDRRSPAPTLLPMTRPARPRW